MNMFAGTRRNMTLGFPDHLTKWELCDAFREAYLKDRKLVPHQIVANGPVLENVLTGDAIDVTKFPGAGLAREGRRPLHRHRHLQHHPRSGRRLAQRRRLSRPGVRQDHGRHPDGAGPPRHHPLRKIFQARRADAGLHGAGRRPAVLLLRRAGSALRHVRDRHRRRLARPGDADGARQGHRAAVPRPRRDRAGGLCLAGQAHRRRPVRRMDRALRRRRQALHRARHQGDLSSQRSYSARACRRWAPGPTRWRATAR